MTPAEIARELRGLARSMFDDCRGEQSPWAKGQRDAARQVRRAANAIEAGRLDGINPKDEPAPERDDD